MRDLVKELGKRIDEERRTEINFTHNRPSEKWVDGFMSRQKLNNISVHIMEDKRVEAITPEILAEHISRIKAEMDRYRIKDSRLFFDLDESGWSIAMIRNHVFQKVVEREGSNGLQSGLSVKRGLDLFTTISVVSGDIVAHKLIVLYPGALRP